MTDEFGFDLEDELYRESDGVNWSALKHIIFNPRYFKDLIDGKVEHAPSSVYQDQGSLLDAFLFEKDKLERDFILAPDGMETPSSAQQKLFMERYKLSGFAEDAYIGPYVVSSGWQKKAAELAVKLTPYIKFQAKAKGKIIYLKSDLEAVAEIEKNIKASPMLNFLFFAQSDDRYTILRQHVIEVPFAPLAEGFCHEIGGEVDGIVIDASKFEGITLKGKLDIVVRDNEKNSGLIIDLKKTSAKIEDFSGVIDRYNYKDQLGFYALLWSVDGVFPVNSVSSGIVAAEWKSPNRVQLFRPYMKDPNSLFTRCLAHFMIRTSCGDWDSSFYDMVKGEGAIDVFDIAGAYYETN